jgi:acetyltransferase
VFFAPETVAVFGATEAPGSVGRTVMANLIGNPFGGTLLPVNPRRHGVLGVKAYRSLAAVPMPVDLAIVATPAPTVPDIIAECSAAGVKGAIIMSAGFRESGPSGAELEQRIVTQLRHSPMRVLGPSCLGLACPRTGINATYSPAMVRPGSVGFLSQSGSLLPALLAGGLPSCIGCSAFISVGAMIDIGWADWLAYLGDDPQTEIIAVYAEVIGDAPSFFSAIRKVTPHKPVIVLKAGRAGTAARSTGAAGERDEDLEEAFRRAGALRAATVAELFRMAEILQVQPVPPGPRLVILSNAGALAMLAADALHTEGAELAVLAPATAQALDQVLPPWGNRQNPIDIGDDADVERYVRAATIAAQDPNSDGLLLILTPHVAINPLEVARRLARLTRPGGKPLYVCWMWGAAHPDSLTHFDRAGVPTFSCPQEAVRAFGRLWRHGDAQRRLNEGSPGDVGHTSPCVMSKSVLGLESEPEAPPELETEPSLRGGWEEWPREAGYETGDPH